ncbi:glycosyltransferase family 39 protein [Haloarcula brevis]|uniref:glycosyltransferase family 39 protein n=1 Tax=Haloarcula brevis TaxID=3111453 RepID=UPI00300E6EAF
MVRIRSAENSHIIAVIVLASALRLFALGEESLWTDELLTLMFVQRWDGIELAIQLPQAQPHLPVYYLLLDAWIRFVGTSEFALRLPSAVFGIAAVGVIYLVGREAANHWVGLLASVILAVSRFHVRYSQEVRMYSLLVLLVLLSLYLLLRIRADRTRRAVAAYGAVTVVLLYTHVFAVFVVAAEVLWILAVVISKDDRASAAQRWVAPFAPVAVAAIPMAVAVFLRVRGGVSYSFIPLPTLLNIGEVIVLYMGYRGGPALPLYVAPLAVVCGLAAFGALGNDPRRPRHHGLRNWSGWVPRPGEERVLFTLVLAAAIGLPFVVSYTITPVFWDRYTIAASVGLFLLVALGIDRIGAPTLRYVLAGIVLLSMLPQLGVYYTETQKEEWDATGAYVERNAESGDLVIVADQISQYGAEHYVDRSDVRVLGLVAAKSGTGYAPASNETITEMAAGEDRVWLMLSHISESESERVRTVLGQNMTVAVDRPYEGVRLLLFVRSENGTSRTVSERTTTTRMDVDAASPADTTWRAT